MAQTIYVGMSQLAIVKSPGKIEAQALGSCVGIVLYDSCAKIGGVAHALLPDIIDANESSRGNLAKFASTAVDELLVQMEKQGANRKLVKAKIAGGANMFPDLTSRKEFLIGKRNTDSARNKLKELNIAVIAEETGGTFGRTITLDTATGKLRVKTILHGEREI